jgi:hypothetical protein
MNMPFLFYFNFNHWTDHQLHYWCFNFRTAFKTIYKRLSLQIGILFIIAIHVHLSPVYILAGISITTFTTPFMVKWLPFSEF